ncbi:MAG: prolyl oligopeptidase family serine peptidase [Pirellulaceae bacterium]|nr:prolyl oligopeptidase family serine peptidase [Pirellulaceae bacterium]
MICQRQTSKICVMFLGTILAIGLVSQVAADDRKPLDHDAYDQWKSVSAQVISVDGNWFSYQTSQGWDATEVRRLYIRSTKSEVEYMVERGRSVAFTRDSRFAVLVVDPDPAAVKKSVADKTPEEQRPQPQLVIVNLETGRIKTTANVRSYQLPEKGTDWVAYLVPAAASATFSANRNKLDPALVPKQNAAGITTLVKLFAPVAGERPKGNQSSAPTAPSAEKSEPATVTGAPVPNRGRSAARNNSAKQELVLEQLSSGRQWRFPNTSVFAFDKFGKHLSWVVEGDSEQAEVWLAPLQEPIHPRKVLAQSGKLTGLVFDEAGERLAFAHQAEAEADKKQKQPGVVNVYLYRLTDGTDPAVVATTGTPGIPEAWTIQPQTPLSFSKSGQRLFFNTTPKVATEADANNAGESKATGPPAAKLDVWHWSEPLLQTVQQVQINRLRQENYRAVYHVQSSQVVQLAQAETPSIVISNENDGNYGILVTQEPYLVERTWETPGFSDVWLVDVRTGTRSKVLEKIQANVQLSPNGQYVYWWDGQLKQWNAMETRLKKVFNLSEGLPYAMHDEEHDTPSLPSSYGAVGWTENDKNFLLYDRYDLWQVDPTQKQAPVCLTQGLGRQRQIRLRRERLDREEKLVPTSGSLYLSAFAETTKSSGYFELQQGQESKLVELILLPELLGGLLKAEEVDTVVLTRQDFRRYPDHWKTNLQFADFQRLTKVNAQQNDYRWGSAELIDWTSATGRPLTGLLYKPDNFDPKSKYPMLVYYYERDSDNLHRYYSPAAGRSVINISFYVSRGYVVFVPDIVYASGSPGKSAMDCIIPGVDRVLSQGFVDEKRIGLQGHSWGGYQTAYLVSQTNRFAAAEAGAPVANMTSAYGGIRWESGLSRMFQYERTQSRIGRTLWEDRQAYIDNSPLFFADQIKTPLLILHNDNDGAVPWYQGIELFMALRRLGRPAWLLNYNGEPHGITKEENRRDFAMRMQQFFDHYLQGAPASEWMISGIPATEKGREFGLELVLPPPAEK